MRKRRVSYKALPTEPDATAPETERIAPLTVDDGLAKLEHRLGDTVAMYAACVCARCVAPMQSLNDWIIR